MADLITQEQINGLYPSSDDKKEMLEEKKIKAELVLLAKTSSEKFFPAPVPKNIWTWIEKNTAKLVAIGSFFTAILFLVTPLYNYLENAGKREEAHFNSEMIGIVKDISDTSEIKRLRALSMLTTYDQETVIPFLLQDIIEEPDDNKRIEKKQVSTEQVLNAIKKMWRSLKKPTSFQKFWNCLTVSKSKREIVLEKINQDTEIAFAEIKNYDVQTEYVTKLIDWYLVLLSELNLVKEDKKIEVKVDSLLVQAKKYVSDSMNFKNDFKSLIDNAKKSK